MSNFQPLNYSIKIVEKDGTPTNFFTRWANQRMKEISGSVPPARLVSTNNGLTGGGDLSVDRTIGLNLSGALAANQTIVWDGTQFISTDYKIATLKDVDVSTPPSNGQVLTWDSTSTKWKPETPSGGGGGSVVKYINLTETSFPAGSTFGSGFWGGRTILIAEDCTISSIMFQATSASPSTILVPTLYNIDSAGHMSTLASSGPAVTGVLVGTNELPLSTPLAVTKGTRLGIGFICNTASFSGAYVTGNDACYFSQSTTTPPTTAPTANYNTNSHWANMYLKATV